MTLGECAQLWLERASGPKGKWERETRERYGRHVNGHILRSPDPRLRPLGEEVLRKVTTDQVAEWSLAIQQVLAPTTATATFRVLNQVLRFAVRRRWVDKNPIDPLEPSEKPRGRPREVRILEPAELSRLLQHARRYRLLFEFLAYTGLRSGEALGLRWSDVDFEARVIRVRQQLSSRTRTPKRLKTASARRDVVLAPALATSLGERRRSWPHKLPGDLVFATASGRGLDYVKVWEGFSAAARRAGLSGEDRLSPHCLRHSFASLLIAKGLNVVFVSRQLGHATPSTTLSTYAHAFDQASYSAIAREALNASYGMVTKDR